MIKRLFILLMVIGLSLFGAVSSSTLTTVTANEVYYVSTEIGVGLQAQHVSLYIEYTKGDEDGVYMSLGWLPDADWAGTTYYIISERVLWWGAIPLIFDFWADYNEMFRIRVPQGISRLYVIIDYDGGTEAGWGTFKINTKMEKN